MFTPFAFKRVRTIGDGTSAVFLVLLNLVVPGRSHPAWAAPSFDRRTFDTRTFDRRTFDTRTQAHLAKMLGEAGEDAYDAALAGRWGSVAKASVQLKRSYAQLPTRWRGLSDQPDFASSLRSLRLPGQSRSRWRAANAANRITLLAARLEQPTGPVIPTAIALLDVYGRALQIAGGRNDAPGARKAVGTLEFTWTQIRPRVLNTGGGQAAKRFDSALQRAHRAQSAAQWNDVSRQLLELVDVLERVFVR